MNWNIFQWRSHKIGIAVPRLPEPTVAPSHFAGKLLTGILAFNLVAVMLVALNLREPAKE